MIQVQPIRSLLVCVDLDAAPESLLRAASAFAISCGADLHVLNVFDRGRLAAETDDWLDMQKSIHTNRLALHSMLSRELSAEIDVKSIRVVLGTPGEVIPAQAEDCGVDLIVIGPHKPHAIGDRYLGSTAERVVRIATVPCLVLNGEPAWPIQRILVPADFSAPSRRALRRGVLWVRTMSARGPVEIDFVHVLDSGAGGRPAPDEVAAITRDLEHEVRAATTEAAVKVKVNVRVLEGDDPATELIRYATSETMDLVVMGTRGDSMLLRGLLGSVSSGILRRSTLPLLLVPPLALVDGEQPEMEPGSWVSMPHPLGY